mmetsp:Transcript_33874/g.73708  ORF Transcript_33874/g.73708 Transcript_33874/m.73708 type:complete len:293 (-) Transcript_33874:541-1419(-)
MLYFSMSTSASDQYFKLLMCFNFPPFVKKSLEYFPESAHSLGGASPISSIMSARWSSSRDQSSPVRGSKRKSPVVSSKNIQAALHTSAVSSQSAPMMTSGDLYWRVWISSVTFLLVRQPFPKSASLANTLSKERLSKRSRCRTGGTGFPQAAAATWSASTPVSASSAAGDCAPSTAATAAASWAGASLACAASAGVFSASEPAPLPAAAFCFSFFFIRFFWLLESTSVPWRSCRKRLWARRASVKSSERSCRCTRTFSSFTSVWMIPRAWMYSRPKSVCRAMRWTMLNGKPL